jgi:LmbE family N-acetylglucosaminyl deacetylase
MDALRTVPQIFCCDTYGSRGIHGSFQPDQLLDVTRVWEKKLAAIHAHKSQPLAFYLDMIERQCQIHGKAAGTQYAEAFLHVPLFGWLDDSVRLGV